MESRWSRGEQLHWQGCGHKKGRQEGERNHAAERRKKGRWHEIERFRKICWSAAATNTTESQKF